MFRTQIFGWLFLSCTVFAESHPLLVRMSLIQAIKSLGIELCRTHSTEFTLKTKIVRDRLLNRSNLIKLRNQTPLNLNWCILSRREVLIRISALLQRKTSIETKNHTLKCLKWHYVNVRSMQIVAVLTEDGAFALFFRPHPGGFDSSRVPTLRNSPSKAKKMLMPGDQPGGLGAGGID